MGFVFDFLKQTDKQVFRIDEAARCASVHVNTMRNWTDQGKIPSMRNLGGHRRITREALLTLGASMNGLQAVNKA